MRVTLILIGATLANSVVFAENERLQRGFCAMRGTVATKGKGQTTNCEASRPSLMAPRSTRMRPYNVGRSSVLEFTNSICPEDLVYSQSQALKMFARNSPSDLSTRTGTYCGWTKCCTTYDPRNDDSSANTNQPWFPTVSRWCRIWSIHSRILFRAHRPAASEDARWNPTTAITKTTHQVGWACLGPPARCPCTSFFGGGFPY